MGKREEGLRFQEGRIFVSSLLILGQPHYITWTDTCSSATGHFTQLVWRNTTTVGCARTECNGGQTGGNGDAPGWYVHMDNIT